jgi:hypothetical protein
MSRNDDTSVHRTWCKETGRFRMSKEQQDVIDRLMGNTVIELEENTEPTLELSQLRKK